MYLCTNFYVFTLPYTHTLCMHRYIFLTYNKCADDTRSQFNLGVCFQEGQGVEKNLHKAAKWSLLHSLSFSLFLSLSLFPFQFTVV